MLQQGAPAEILAQQANLGLPLHFFLYFPPVFLVAARLLLLLSNGAPRSCSLLALHRKLECLPRDFLPIALIHRSLYPARIGRIARATGQPRRIVA